MEYDFKPDSIDNGPIYNLHPALPGTFIGNNAVEQALQSFQRGETTTYRQYASSSNKCS